MSSHTIEDLTSCMLDFQANMVRVTFRKKTTLVEPDYEPLHDVALRYIWEMSEVEEGREDVLTAIKWRKLGFETEDLGQEFREVGVLGLDCLVCLFVLLFGRGGGADVGPQKHFVEKDPDFWHKVVQEQLSRPEERRCPIAKASNEVTDLLSEHWAIYAPGCAYFSFLGIPLA